MRRAAFGWLALAACAAACRATPGATPRDGLDGSAAVGEEAADGGGEVGEAEPVACEEGRVAEAPLPGVSAEQRTAAYWIERTRAWADPDEVLLSAERIADHDRALQQPVEGRGLGRADLLAPIDLAALRAEVNGRIASLRASFARGEFVDARGRRFGERASAALAPREGSWELRVELRAALEPLEVRCGPTRAGYYTVPPDEEFDRNICSGVRPQEPVQVLADWDDELWLVRTATVVGWLPREAALSPPVPERWRAALAAGPRVRLAPGVRLAADDGARLEVRARTTFAEAPGEAGAVLFADRAGFHAGRPEDGSPVEPAERPLTRRAVFEEAFGRLDEPYGWGGRRGGLDCSGFVQEVFGAFGLVLPRHSGHQARAGTFSIGLEGVVEPAIRLRLIEEAARRGVVLLQFPGHVMLYLGTTEDGVPMAIHAFHEFAERCGGAEVDGASREVLRRVGRVDVSTLELGAGTSRGSFLERLTRIAVIGGEAGELLAGVAEYRAAAPVAAPRAAERGGGGPAACDDTLDVALFRSPRVPHAGHRLRVIATSVRPLEPVELVLFGPDGTRYVPAVHRLGGPPWAWWVELDDPAAGEWAAVLGDGTRVEACETFRVARHAPRAAPREAGAPPWTSPLAWERDTEALYAAFVEQLFREPVGEEATWPDLQALLSDPARNLLHDHLGLGEDETLRLVPDCADLPYFLRAYFAWKLRLPFAFRRCTRGREGAPPLCPAVPYSNLDPDGSRAAALAAGAAGGAGAEGAAPPAEERGEGARAEREAGTAGGNAAGAPRDDVEAFAEFIGRVARSVHSATARTVPGTDASDLYPVALERSALAPGAVFADPYGHVLVVAAWIPQPADGYGMLLGAEAQPDGTVGRRRFWRGSFLFDPATRSVGAGFKAWRPASVDRATGLVVTAGNAELTGSADHPAYSEEQYRGSAEAFYDRMEALIQPRPLAPARALEAVLDALEEAVVRRVVSVDNGERWVREHPGVVIAMPEGHAVFETEGPWEDYATPSRDLRLLIAIDAVLGFPEGVGRAPERYGLAADEAAGVVEELRAGLEAGLAGRRFSYVGTDGARRELTLRDVVERRAALEAAYNPNDCVEVRWGAPEGSAEAAACGRRAPEEQRLRMEEYRAWFRARKRPPR